MTHEAVLLTTSLVLLAIYGGVLLSLLFVHIHDQGSPAYLFNRSVQYDLDSQDDTTSSI
jgi:hypothetical protein